MTISVIEATHTSEFSGAFVAFASPQLPPLPRTSLSRARRQTPDREANGHRGAFFEPVAGYVNRAPVRFDYSPGNGQSQAGSTNPSIPR